ncbi:MAG: YggT family protein [Waddliaceae bacterium]|nr:YggT family protein [Waddliaceae bacterium]
MGLVEIVQLFFLIYTLMLFVRILSSWIPELHELELMAWVCGATDPYLDLFRRIIPPIGMMDISPLFAFIALHFVEKIILMLII